MLTLNNFALKDSSDSELALDGRDERWSLKQSSCKELKGPSKLGLSAGDLVVKPDNAHILLSCTLL